MKNKKFAMLMAVVAVSGLMTVAGYAADSATPKPEEKTAKEHLEVGVEHAKLGAKHIWHETENGAQKVGSHIKEGAEKLGEGAKSEAHKANKHLHAHNSETKPTQPNATTSQ